MNDLVCFCEDFVVITVFVQQMNNLVLKLAIVQELIEFVRISSQFSRL